MTGREKHEHFLAEAERLREEAGIIHVEEEWVKLVIFLLGADLYAFYGKDIKEILRFETPTYVPGSPPIILGIINVRGDIESVLSVRRVLGLSESHPTARSRILLAAADGIRSGILVDEVQDVTDVPVGSIRPAGNSLDTSLEDLVVGITLYEGRDVTVLGVGRLLWKLGA